MRCVEVGVLPALARYREDGEPSTDGGKEEAADAHGGKEVSVVVSLGEK